MPVVVGLGGGIAIGSVIGLRTRTERGEARPLVEFQPACSDCGGTALRLDIGVPW